MIRVHAFHLRGKGWGQGIGPSPTHCADCGAEIVREPGSITTGYGCEPGADIMDGATFAVLTGEPAPMLKPGETIGRSRAVCFECCGRHDVATMTRTGRASLYLTRDSKAERLLNQGPVPRAMYRVSNWPGTLDLACSSATHSNYGGGFGSQRTDVWFTGPDGKQWHGVNRGDSQILRCKRLVRQ